MSGCRLRILAGLFWLAAACLRPSPVDAAQQFQGLCAVVKMEILQELTLERVGFLATLEITNNEGDASITDFSATLSFENPALSLEGGVNDASGVFFVQPPQIAGITGIDGTGILGAGQKATVSWFIIPKILAGGTDPAGTQYYVGAKLAGVLNGQPIPAEMLAVIPDSIVVKPDPQLEITYFQPRDVDGDDPFTPDVVETPIPFTLGVLVKNAGHGEARQLRIASQQPRIVENKQGLLLVAQLLGARVDDRPLDDASLTVNLGDIQPGKCRKGAWDMITSLSGEFIAFSASYTHASELGGRDTSIITALNAHFIAREARNDQPGRDALLDFLADTDRDPEMVPDTLYESDCNEVPVNRLLDVGLVESTGLTSRVRARADFENWVYLRLDDPAQARYAIARVERSDGKVLDPRNYWTNVRYRRGDNARLAYLNILDFVALGDYEYTVTYAPAAQDTVPPVSRLRFAGPVQEAGGRFFVLPETQLYFTVEDASPVGTSYRLDGAGAFLPAYPFRLSAAGEHTIEFYSRDSAGNEEALQMARVVLTRDYPALAGLALDRDTIVIAGDALSVRAGGATVSFDASGAVGAIVEAEVFRGAYGWVTLGGVPSSPTAATGATLVVGGQNVDYYRYRLGTGAWSAEFPVAAPLALAGLGGNVSVTVAGRSRYGSFPPDAQALTVSWSVGEAAVAVTGAPPTPAPTTDAFFSVSGSDHYCYRLDGGAYRPEPAVGVPVALADLAEGAHSFEVLPRASAATPCPGDVPGVAAHWTVDRAYATGTGSGERVRRVDLGTAAGLMAFSWDGRDDAGVAVPSGWYTLRITVRDSLGRATRAALLVRVGDLLAAGAPLAGGGGAAQREAHAVGAWAVWQDQRSGSWNVFAQRLTDPAAVAAALAPSPRNQERPRTDGRYAVWEDRQPDGSWDIWAAELGAASPAYALTSTPNRDERRPAVSWPWVVYQSRPAADPSAPWQLVAQHLVTGATAPVAPSTQDQLDPSVHRGRVAWQDFRDVGYGEIYAKDLPDGAVRRLTSDAGGQYHPAVYDDWVVWADNRHAQFDLYGYNYLRGTEVRLTATPEDETRPFLNGKWVVYEEDAAGELLVNLRLLHLSNLAAVQLTTVGSAKEKPSLASGRVLWVDAAGGRAEVRSAKIPDLQPVFNDRNAVAVTAGMAVHRGDAHALLRLWQAQAGVTAITRYTALLPEPVAETATWEGGAPAGANFALEPGSFLWVKFGAVRILDLGEGACGALHLGPGTSVFSYSCFPDDYTAYRLLRELGLDRATAVRALDAETGRWVAAAVVGGSIVGEDFRVAPVSVLMLELAAAADPWTPGE